MKGILIFDQLNDILFVKCNEKFASHIETLAKQQGLSTEINDASDLSENRLIPNIIMQLFSPIVTSQQVMASQFGNIYTSIKCQDGTNMVFDNYMGFTFIYVSNECREIMKKTLAVCTAIVRHICGPDVSILKVNEQKTQMVSLLLDAWKNLRDEEQSILTESIDQLAVNPDLTSSSIKILSDACDKLKTHSEILNVHLLIIVERKFLSLFSSKNALDLLPSDILILIILCHLANNKAKKFPTETNIVMSRSSLGKKEDTGKLSNPVTHSSNSLGDSGECTLSSSWDIINEVGLYSQVLLLGSEETEYTINAVHIFEMDKDINLVTVIETTNLSTSTGLYDSFYHLNAINNFQLQRNFDELKPAFDNLESALKKTMDGLKKYKGNDNIEMCQKRLQIKRDVLKKKYAEFLRSRDAESMIQLESQINYITETLQEIFRLISLNTSFLINGTDLVIAISKLIRQKLNDLSDFSKLKDPKQTADKSKSSMTINKYLEEFPGLVHFIHIDRVTHRLTAPVIDFSNAETTMLTKKKIWEMINQSQMHLEEGHFLATWKDTTFNYAYFLWFEDNSGTPLKCKTYSNQLIKNQPVPGILCGDYYRKLAETYFPKLGFNKLRIYELYCVHLGLATSQCVLEHARRLSATIWEVNGLYSNPIDLL